MSLGFTSDPTAILPSLRELKMVRPIGGSDIPKLLGISNYGGPYQVYQRVVEGIEDDWNEQMLRGTMMEPVLRAHGQRMFGLELEERADDYVQSSRYEFAHAQIDDLARWQGLPIVAEYKSQSEFARGWIHGADGDVIPESIRAQVTWQLMCTERELALVVVGFGKDTKTGDFELNYVTPYEVQRDLEFEAYCLLVVREFVERHVLRRVPPPFQAQRKRRAS